MSARYKTCHVIDTHAGPWFIELKSKPIRPCRLQHPLTLLDAVV